MRSKARNWAIAKFLGLVAAASLAAAIVFGFLAGAPSMSQSLAPVPAVEAGDCSLSDPLKTILCVRDLLNTQTGAKQGRISFETDQKSAWFGVLTAVFTVGATIAAFAGAAFTFRAMRLAEDTYEITEAGRQEGVLAEQKALAIAQHGHDVQVTQARARPSMTEVRIIASGGGLLAGYKVTNGGPSEARNLKVRFNSFVSEVANENGVTQYSRYEFLHSDLFAGGDAILTPSANRYLGEIPPANNNEGHGVRLEILMHFHLTYRDIFDVERSQEFFLRSEMRVDGSEETPEVFLVTISDGPARVRSLRDRGNLVEVTNRETRVILPRHA